MKKFIGILFFVLLAVGISTAKDFSKDSLYYGAPGDSVNNIKFNSLYKYTYITYQDTGATLVLGGLRDSLIIESYDLSTATWHLVGLIDITTDTVATTLVGISGSTKKYLINEVRPYQIRIRLVNYREAFPARKGYIGWSGEND